MEQVTLNLNKDELQIILESLCSFASTDVHCPQYLDTIQKALNLAISLRKQNSFVPIVNAFALTNETGKYYDQNTEKLIEYFPELVENL